MTRPIVFLDTETLGLGLDDPIWEIALIRREVDGSETSYVAQLTDRSAGWLRAPADFPESFRGDFEARYRSHDEQRLPWVVAAHLRPFLDDRPTIVGAVPNFDTERITHQLGVTGWHHRLRCVETLTAGHLGRDVGGLADCAEALGIPVEDAHTAMGDVLMVRAIWDRIMGSAA